MSQLPFVFKKDQFISRFMRGNVETRLLAKSESVEVLKQFIPAKTVFHLTSADEWQGFEFFQILSGKLRYMDAHPVVDLEPGDYIARKLVPQRSMFETQVDTVILSFSSEPTYQFIRKEVEDYVQLAHEIEKDEYTEGHSFRIQHLSRLLGEKLGLSGERLRNLINAAFFHDLGKAKVPKAILRKAGRLSPEEQAIMRQHASWGKEMLDSAPYLQAAGQIVEQTHEHCDGSGYPKGLRGQNISLEARIIAVADAYDAMTTDRPYRNALPQDESIRRLESAAGTQLDGEVVAAFTEMLESQGLMRPDVDRQLARLRQHEAILQIGEEILANKEIDEILNRVVFTIVTYSPFRRAALALYAKPIAPESTEEVSFERVVCVGLSPEEEQRLKENPLPASERPKIFQDQFRLSRSFYIPHDQLPWREHPGLITVGNAQAEGTWHPDDFICIPLRIRNQYLGVISVDEPNDGQAPIRETLEPIELLAGFAALALDRTQHLQRLKSVYALSEHLAKVDSIDLLLQQSMEVLTQHFSTFDYSGISFLEQGELVLQHWQTKLTASEFRLADFDRISVDEGLLGWAVRNRCPVVVDDVLQDSRYIQGHKDIRSELVTLVEDQEEVLGVLNLESRHVSAFTQEDLELAQALGRQLGTAIANLRRRSALRASLDEQKRFSAFLKRLNQATELDEAIELTIERGIELLKPRADAGCLLLWNHDKRVFEFAVAVNRDLEKLKVTTFSERQLRPIFALGRPLILSRSQQLQDPTLRKISQASNLPPPASTISIPIRNDGRVVALLNINNLAIEGAFAEVDAAKVLGLVPEIELVLHRLRDRENLKRQAQRDSLTGMYNRHYLSEMVEARKHARLRVNHPVSLIMIDFVGFFHVNDRFGHLEGDRVLKEAAALFGRNVREQDDVIRYGGDEFLIVLPNTPGSTAQEICQRLERAIAENDWGFPLSLSISTGVALWTPNEDVTFEGVLEEADAWMFRQKRGAKSAPAT